MRIAASLAVIPVTLGLLIVAPPLATGPARADVTIIGDDDRNAFVGSGSLLLPQQISTNGRQTAATCPGCTWRSVIQCEMTTAGSCRGPARLCGPDGYWLRVYVTRPGLGEIDLGAACFGSGGPVTRESAEGMIRDRLVTRVPDLKPWRQPAGRVLPHLPVVFGVVNGDAAITESFDLIGLPIVLNARPRWVWDFGDGAVTMTASPGSRWPDAPITHTYRKSGGAVVRVTALWEATYEVGGIGPLTVPEPVTQRDATSLRVGQGRAVLIR